MAIEIEDGSGVSGANSYVTRSEYIAYALTLGITIADAAATDDNLVAAALYIDSQEPKLKGYRVERDQSLAYPRNGLFLEGFVWESDEIPTQVKLAQYNLALDLESDIDIYNPAKSESIVKSEKVVGAVEVEYAVKEEGTKSVESRSTIYMDMITNHQTLSIPLVMA